MYSTPRDERYGTFLPSLFIDVRYFITFMTQNNFSLRNTKISIDHHALQYLSLYLFVVGGFPLGVKKTYLVSCLDCGLY